MLSDTRRRHKSLKNSWVNCLGLQLNVSIMVVGERENAMGKKQFSFWWVTRWLLENLVLLQWMTLTYEKTWLGRFHKVKIKPFSISTASYSHWRNCLTTPECDQKNYYAKKFSSLSRNVKRVRRLRKRAHIVVMLSPSMLFPTSPPPLLPSFLNSSIQHVTFFFKKGRWWCSKSKSRNQRRAKWLSAGNFPHFFVCFIVQLHRKNRTRMKSGKFIQIPWVFWMLKVFQNVMFSVVHCKTQSFFQSFYLIVQAFSIVISEKNVHRFSIWNVPLFAMHRRSC